MITRTTPKRVVVKPWPFGFRVDPGRLKVDTAYDPEEVVFVNRTAFAVDLRFDPSPFGIRDKRIEPGKEVKLGLAADAEGWYEYQVLVSVSAVGIEMQPLLIEASGGSRPGIEIHR